MVPTSASRGTLGAIANYSKRKKMRKILFIVISFMFITFIYSLSYDEAKDNFTLANLITGMKKDDVINIHGKPIKIEDDPEDVTGKASYWYYDGFKVYFYGDNISFVVLINDKYQTKRGIKVGDPISNVLNKYKGAQYDKYIPYDKNEPTIIRYYYSVMASWDLVSCGFCTFRINFRYENDIIIEISSFVDYCPRS
jgi:hypothetical protein